MSRTTTMSSTDVQSVRRSPSSTSDTTTDSDASTSPRLVRFDERCILIPQCTGKSTRQPPRIGTIDLPLPIPVNLPWRWPNTTSPRDKEQDCSEEAGTEATQEKEKEAPATVTPKGQQPQLILKVPYPIFRRKSQSSLTSPINYPLASCLVHRHAHSSASHLPHSASEGASTTTTYFNQKEAQTRRQPKRSASLPPSLADKDVITIPLRPCCERCLPACETHKSRLPTLEETSREHSPAGSKLNLLENGNQKRAVDEEDWCAGLHFTKGALKLRRSASSDYGKRHSQDGSGLIEALVRVDEVDCKRGTSPTVSPRNSMSGSSLKLPPNKLSTRDIDRLRGTTPPSRSPVSDEPEEDLFPLPSPKRSPSASPADSATCLPVQTPPTEPRRLEAAIKAKMASAARERERTVKSTPISSPLASSSPMSIPGNGKSYFCSYVDEIEYDPSLPDPDALPADSDILLNSPPRSLTSASMGASVNGRSPVLSASPPTIPMHSPEPMPLSPSEQNSNPPASMERSPPKLSRTASTSPVRHPSARRASISNIIRAGAGVLKGISMSAPAGQGGPTQTLSSGLIA